MLPSSYRKLVPHFGQNPLGRGREWGLLARVVIPRFLQKAKENRRAARFRSMLNLFSHRGRLQKITKQDNENNRGNYIDQDQATSGGGRHGPPSISSFAATASTTSSSHGRPTICTPIGKPSSECPIGTTAAGKPSRLNHSQ